jgi:hypothetical protein
VEAIQGATGATFAVEPGSPTVTFPPIATARLDKLIGPERAPLTTMIGELVRAFAS